MSEDEIPTGFQLLELDPDFRADPYPRLRALQSRCPVRHDPMFASVVLTRYEDVRAAVNDHSLWRSPERGRPEALLTQVGATNGPGRHSILFMDDPDHARIRGPLTQAFYKRAARMRPRVEAIVDATLDEVQGREAFDVIADFGVPVPILVLAALLGIEAGRLRDFREWSENVIYVFKPFRTPDEEAALQSVTDALTSFFDESIADRRAAPKDDLITDMVRLQADGARITDDELNANLSGLLIGGNLTTTDLIGNGTRALLGNPDQLALLRADPKLISAAVEEVLRYDPPITLTGRVVSAPMVIGGHEVAERETLMSFLRAANRDPEVYADADRFDIARKHVPHVAFGGGAHICIGAPLARMVGQVAIWSLFERFPDLRLADQELSWRPLANFRGLERLVVER